MQIKHFVRSFLNSVTTSYYYTNTLAFQYASLSQRDISINSSLDQLIYPGVVLQSVLFESDKPAELNVNNSITGIYTSYQLSYLSSLLDGGVRRMFINLYWNERIGQWQLCPAPLDKIGFNESTPPSEFSKNSYIYTILGLDGNYYQCQPSATVKYMLQLIDNQISKTNSDTQAYMLHIALNVSSIYPNETNDNIALNDNNKLSSILNQVYDALILTPTQINHVREKLSLGSNQWPNASLCLFSLNNRVFFSIYQNSLSNLNSYDIENIDKDYIFSNDQIPLKPISSNEFDDCISDPINYANYIYSTNSIKSQYMWRVAIDDGTMTNSTSRQIARCGYSPAIDQNFSHLASIINIMESSLWSWAYDEPIVYDISLSQTSSVSGSVSTIQTTSTPTSSSDFTLMSTSSTSSILIPSSTVLTGNTIPTLKYNQSCAVMTINGWAKEDCNTFHLVACRLSSRYPNGLNKWIISNLTAIYSTAEDLCNHMSTSSSSMSVRDSYENNYQVISPRDNIEAVFSVPKNPLEYSILLKEIHNSISPDSDVWIDMNSIDISDCWVTGGPNAKCPFHVNSQLRYRLVTIMVSVAILVSFYFFASISNCCSFRANRARKPRRKLIKEYMKLDTDGVPL